MFALTGAAGCKPCISPTCLARGAESSGGPVYRRASSACLSCTFRPRDRIHVASISVKVGALAGFSRGTRSSIYRLALTTRALVLCSTMKHS